MAFKFVVAVTTVSSSSSSSSSSPCCFHPRAPPHIHISFHYNHAPKLHSNTTTTTTSRKPTLPNRQHHLWKTREDSPKSRQKAINLVRIVSELPHHKDAVYASLDKFIAWETHFPLIAVAKALRIFRNRNMWPRVIQVSKWMLSKGQGATMGTYDTLLLAFDMDDRVDEAKSLWNMILHTSTRSISKRLFSRIISLYDHHNMPNEIVEVFGDMEELGVKPDEDTVRRVTRAFKELGEEEKQFLVLKKYMSRWKYIHFKGERVKVKRNIRD